MSGNEAYRKMKEIESIGDSEIRHIKADDMLCEILKECGGYEEVIELFKAMTKWYA